MALTLQRREQNDRSTIVAGVSLTPPLDDYWAYRVQLTPKQAVVGFPKHGTIGIGFEREEDWNTNLPYRLCTTKEIRKHIWHNRGDKKIITKEMVDEAIDLVREAAAADLGTELKR